LYGIEVRKSGAGMTVELRGEWDLSSLSDLRETLGSVLDLGRSAIVDLSGITFLDLNSARELAVHSQLYALSLRDPSPQVTASLEAFRLRDWFRFRSDGDRKEPTAVSETSS
jgi:anti-anti-sigma regulatory factor